LEVKNRFGAANFEVENSRPNDEGTDRIRFSPFENATKFWPWHNKFGEGQIIVLGDNILS
jgi:hypothetical protein